jgi:hypothetical protein
MRIGKGAIGVALAAALGLGGCTDAYGGGGVGLGWNQGWGGGLGYGGWNQGWGDPF